MKRIALIHPELGLGGPDTVAAWIAEILKQNYSVDFILCKEFDFERINSLYGTSLSKDNVGVRIVKSPSFIKNSAKGRLLKQHFLMRYCKINGLNYDLMFSTYNEMDFGRKGIQYIHFPSMDLGQNARHNLLINKWYYKDSIIRKMYLLLGKAISGYKEKNILKNLTLVNSDWTGNIMQNIYGCKAITLYPPVLDDFKKSLWESRRLGFINIGIISPDKKIPEIISILKKVRENGFNITFTLIGRIRREGAGFESVFQNLIEQNKDWVFYEGVKTRQEMLQIISEHRYGIHAKKEHFGISIAELIKGGCIPFVPDEGGHLEITGGAENYLGFTNEQDALEKIIAVLKNDKLQNEIRAGLAKNIDKFSITMFRENLLKIIDNFFKMEEAVRK